VIIAIFAVKFFGFGPFAGFVTLSIGTIGFFALQYALGGKTQFSFYATVLVPSAGVSMGVFLYEIINWEAFRESLGFYRNAITELKKFLRKGPTTNEGNVREEEIEGENESTLP